LVASVDIVFYVIVVEVGAIHWQNVDALIGSIVVFNLVVGCRKFFALVLVLEGGRIYLTLLHKSDILLFFTLSLEEVLLVIIISFN